LPVPAGLARAGRPGNQQILVTFDPLAARQLLEQRAIEAAGSAMVHVFRGGLLAQPGEPQPCRQPLAVAFQRLALDQRLSKWIAGHGQAVLEAEIGSVGMAPLLLEGAGHAGQTEFAQAVRGGMGRHGCSPQW